MILPLVVSITSPSSGGSARQSGWVSAAAGSAGGGTPGVGRRAGRAPRTGQGERGRVLRGEGAAGARPGDRLERRVEGVRGGVGGGKEGAGIGPRPLSQWEGQQAAPRSAV